MKMKGSSFASMLSDLQSKAKVAASSSVEERKRKREEKADEEEKLKCKRKELGSFQLDFLCIGAQKAATTWLHDMLSRDSSGNVLLPTFKKEVHFWDWNRHKGLPWYALQFPEKERATEQKVGEINPCYSVLSEKDISEIKALFPNVKLIFIARCITDRTWSALRMERRQKELGLDPGQFVESYNDKSECLIRSNGEDEDEYFINKMHELTHTSRSDYNAFLRRWLKYFDPNQLLIVDYEQMTLEPKKILKEIGNHIGVHSLSDIPQADLESKVNVGSSSTSSMSNRVRCELKDLVEPYVKDFNQLLRELGGYDWTLSG